MELRSAMMVADTIIAPVRPSQADLETFGKLSELIMNANSMREMPARVLVAISMAPTHHMVTEMKKLETSLKNILILILLNSLSMIGKLTETQCMRVEEYLN